MTGRPARRRSRLLLFQTLRGASPGVLAKGLTAAFSRHEDVTVAFPPARHDWRALLKGAPARIVPVKDAADLGRLLERARFDEVHYHCTGPDPFGLGRLLRKRPERLTVTLHLIRRAPPAALLERADMITCVSQSELIELRRRYPRHRNKLAAVGNGFDPAEIAAGRIRRFRPPAPFALCVARICREKGFDVLLFAFAGLAARDPRLSLVLVGELRGDLWFDRLLRRLGLRGRVRVYARANRREVLGLMKRSLFVVAPSRRETFGMAALEAMAAGKAVVAARSGGLPELIRHGRTGYLARAGDVEDLRRAMERVRRDGKLRVSLARRAAAFARERFRWDQIARRYRALGA